MDPIGSQEGTYEHKSLSHMCYLLPGGPHMGTWENGRKDKASNPAYLGEETLGS